MKFYFIKAIKHIQRDGKMEREDVFTITRAHNPIKAARNAEHEVGEHNGFVITDIKRVY